MKTKRLSLDDFKKKTSANNETLAYAKGGQVVNNFGCTGSSGPIRPTQDKCHPAAN